MSYKNILICFVLFAAVTFYQTPVVSQEVAVIENFEDPEIDSLVSYLSSMGLQSTVISKDTLTYSLIANYQLVIWDDLGFQGGGLTDSNVSVYNLYYLSGKPLYFIGDDLAYSIVNLSPAWAPIWTSLIHLAGENNYSQSYTVHIIDTTHPVTNGPYGKVNDFDYSLDIDLATQTHTGELVLANTTDSDVLLSYEGSQTRTVSQNCLVIQAGSEPSIAERKKLFKNTVYWLLRGNIGIKKISSEVPKNFKLFQNYPNPFNPVTTINYESPISGIVKLLICNILGEEIAVLVNEKQTAGKYKVTWDASDYPSGVYFYKLVVSGAELLAADIYTKTKKMVLLK